MALFSLRRWGAWHLLFAWCCYWLALVLMVLGPPALLIWRLTHDPARHGGTTASVSNSELALRVTENGATIWAGGTTTLTAALWIVVPPLLLYLAWLRARPARASVGGPAVDHEHVSVAPGASGAVLGAGETLPAPSRTSASPSRVQTGTRSDA